MKICLYSTQVIPSNPDLKGYGGLELICGLLAKYFDEHGHEVSLFASKQSYQPKNGHLYAVGEPGTVDPREAWKAYWATENSKKALQEADIVHDHSWGYYPYSAHTEIKCGCHTHHGPTPGFQKPPTVSPTNFIAVSHNHAKCLSAMTKGIAWRGVENGIDISRYPFQEQKGGYVLWLSRLDWFKGAHRFIDICNKFKIKGIVAGGSFGDTKEYIDNIEKKIEQSQYVESHGKLGVGVSFDEKVELYQNARAVVIPSQETTKTFGAGQLAQWSQFIEPFGLITPEANACGTPVIVMPSGGWHQTMTHGFNGYFAVSDDEFGYYLSRIDEIKPKNCRKMAEHFRYERMAEEYLKLYKECIEGRGW